MNKTFKQNGKLWSYREIKGSPLVMIQELYKTKDSPTGYYSTGPIFFVNPKTGKEEYRQ